MALHLVYFEQMASTVVEVEAETREEAEELAWNELPTGICAQCSGWNNPPGIDLSGDWEIVQESD